MLCCGIEPYVNVFLVQLVLSIVMLFCGGLSRDDD